MRNLTDADNSTDVPISTDVHAPRWAVDNAGEVLVRFDSGFPCLVRNHPRSAALIALLGQPHKIYVGGSRILLSWNVGAKPIETTVALSADYLGAREIVSLSASPAAFLAATRLSIAETVKRSADVSAARAALESAQAKFYAALGAEERAHRRHGAAIVATVTQNAAKSDK